MSRPELEGMGSRFLRTTGTLTESKHSGNAKQFEQPSSLLLLPNRVPPPSTNRGSRGSKLKDAYKQGRTDSGGGITAVDGEDLAGDEGRLLGGEVKGEAGDILRLRSEERRVGKEG